MDYELMQALRETIIMILIPTLVSIIFGLPIGACIYLKNSLSIFCNIYVNVVRSVPYLLFVIILIPLTRLLFSTAFGVLPATLPLCFVGVATFSRFVEQSFGDVNKGVIELAESMKVSKYQLVRYFFNSRGKTKFSFRLNIYNNKYNFLFNCNGNSWSRRYRRLCYTLWIL